MACNVYEIYNPIGGPLSIDYINCDSVYTLESVLPGVIEYKCIDQVLTFGDGLEVTNLGNCGDCLCRTIFNSGDVTSSFSYVDCNLGYDTISIDPYEHIQVCAKLVITGDPNISITNGETCIDSTCPCKCYYTLAGNSDVILRYFDCNGIIQGVVITAGSNLNKKCTRGIISTSGFYSIVFYNTNNLCITDVCPTFFCQCYTVTNNGLTEDSGILYLNCDNQIVTQTINPTETYIFCAQNVQYYLDSKASPNFPVDFTVTNSGDCFNGQCEQSLSIEDQLLLDILAKYGPCPGICDGSTPVGGPAGTSIIDIKNGGIIGSTN
jgi:hypothetical protein